MVNRPMLGPFGHRGKVMDPVHGAIDLYAHETIILDHPLLQRLKRMKQNDVLHYVFPGATHTRFAHSLGVMHIAGRCLESIINTTISDGEKRFNRHFPLSTDQLGAVRYFIYLLRAAALLHDSGHGPFSHEFEKSETLQKLIDVENILESVWDPFVAKKYLGARPSRFNHEEMSVRLAVRILGDVWNPVALQGDLTAEKLCADDAIALLSRSINPTSEIFNAESEKLLSIFLPDPGMYPDNAASSVRLALRSVLSGTLNADAMDYLLRDSYFTGSKYGVFNLDHLISNLRFGYALTTAQKLSWVGIAIREQGVGALDDFAFSRLQLYREVYGHKAVVGFKILLEHSIIEVLRDKKKRRAIIQYLRSVDRYSVFHDDSMVALFQDIADCDHDSACHDFIHRTKLEFLDRLRNASSGRIKQTRTELEAEDGGVRILSRTTNVRDDPTATDVDHVRVIRMPRNGPPELVDLSEVRSSYSQSFNSKTVDFYRADRGWARSDRQADYSGRGIMISAVGLPCCGKSTVMRYLASMLGAAYYREPEEAHWPDAVMDRLRVGAISALTWFRAIRVPYLYDGDEARNRGHVAVVDSCYDKLIAKYLGKQHVRWLIEPCDPYFAAYSEIARIDYKMLPDPDIIIVFKISKKDWRTLLKKRGRALDKNDELLKSYPSHLYFESAAKALAKERGIRVCVFYQDLAKQKTPEVAARGLYAQLVPLLTSLQEKPGG